MMSGTCLYDRAGSRLYLSPEEREVFLETARHQPVRDQTLCEMLHFTGCRPSELRKISRAHIDLSNGTVAIRNQTPLKSGADRAQQVYRIIPVPLEILAKLDDFYCISGQQDAGHEAQRAFWPLSRVRIWQIVRRIMIEAGIPDAPQRTPRGLRHGFGFKAVLDGIPLQTLSRWMGHAQIRTTVVYAEAVSRYEQHSQLACGSRPQ